MPMRQTTLVPYKGNAIIRNSWQAPYYLTRYVTPRMRFAAGVLQAAWRRRQQIKRAYNVVRRGVKRYKMSKIGKRMVAGTRAASKVRGERSAESSDAVFIEHQTLHARLMTYPEYRTTGVLGSRDQYTILLKGWKICRQFHFVNPAPESEAPQIGGPIIMHWALVQQKRTQESDTTLIGDLKDRFFRNNSTDDDKYSSFVNAVPLSEWKAIFNCNPMNPDGEFKVLTHLRHRLQAPARNAGLFVTNGSVNPKEAIWEIRKYIKVNRKQTFGKLDSYVPNHPIYEVYWYSTQTPQDAPDLNMNGTYVRTFAEHQVYYDQNVDIKRHL
ncbi:putative capsid protein [Circoviridae sp.]|nr:putative capsid protein [Circoviridae sp.]